MWSKLAAAIGEFGFPVIMALGMGYFIWYVWKVITIQIKPALGKLFASSIKLTDQLRMLDQDMSRLHQKVKTIVFGCITINSYFHNFKNLIID